MIRSDAETAQELRGNYSDFRVPRGRPAGTTLAHYQDMTSPAVRQFPTMREYMTASPHTIGRARSLSVAAKMMRDNQVRHLPVLDGGRIVGIVSERDILMIEALPRVNPTDVFTTIDALQALHDLLERP